MFTVGERRVLVPQRVEPKRRPADIAASVNPTASAVESDGSGEFRAGVEAVVGDGRATLDRLLAWATDLEQSGLARLVSVSGVNRMVLRVHVPGDAGLVTLWNESSKGWVSPWRTVFLRRAPETLHRVDDLLGPSAIGKGNYLKVIDEQVLLLLADAYREASGR